MHPPLHRLDSYLHSGSVWNVPPYFDYPVAHDAFEFLAQIGGKQYSRKVLKQLADTVFDQTRYERAVEAYRLLIELDPNAGDAPDKSVNARRRHLCVERAHGGESLAEPGGGVGVLQGVGGASHAHEIQGGACELLW